MTAPAPYAPAKLLQRAINAGLVFLTVGVMALGGVALWHSYQLPSIGLGWTLNEGLVTVVEPGGPADGLVRLQDRLLTLNGVSFVGGGDMAALIHNVRPGQPAQLRIERAGVEHTLIIVPQAMPPALDGHLLDYVDGFLLCLLGLYVFANQRSSLTARLFLLFSVLSATVMWANNSLFIDPGYAAMRRLALSVIAPCLLINLVIALPRDRAPTGLYRRPRQAYCLLSLLLGVAGALAALLMLDWSYALYMLILANQPLGLASASYLAFRTYRQLPPGADRDRYRAAVVVLMAGLLPSAITVGLGFFHVWLGYDSRIILASTFTIPLAMAYVVARYRFLGTRMLLRQIATLSLLLCALLAIFVATYLVAAHILAMLAPWYARELALLAAVIAVVALFAPLRRHTWRLVVYALDSRRLELYKTWGTFSHDLTTLRELPALLQALAEQLGTLFPHTPLVIILRRDDDQYHVAQAVGCPHIDPNLVLSPQAPLVQWLQRESRLFASQSTLVEHELLPAGQRLIDDLRPELVVALPGHTGQLLGWLVLGPQGRRSGYDDWEVELVTGLANQASVAIANAQLYDQTKYMVNELQETNRQLEALQQTSVSLTQRLSLSDTARRVVQGVLNTNFYSMALLGVANEAQTALDIVAYANADPDLQGQIEELLGAPVLGATLDLLGPENPAIRAIRQRQVLTTPHLHDIAGPMWSLAVNWTPALPDQVTQLGQRQYYVLAPLYLGDTLKGLLLAGTARSTVPDYEIGLLSTFAQQAALALENAHLWQQTDAELHQQFQELAISHDLTQAINRTLELDTVLTQAVARLLAGTRFDMGLIRLRGDGDNLSEVAQQGIPPALQANPSAALQVQAQRVFQTHQPVIVQDTRDEPDLHDQGVRAYGLWPLVAHGEILGLLMLGTRHEPPLSPPDLQLPGDVAEQLSIAITNAQLHASVDRERQKTQTILQNIGDGVCTVGPDRVLRTWNQAAERLLGYREHQVSGRPCSDVLRCHNAEGRSLCAGDCPLAIAWQEQRDIYSHLGDMFMRASDDARLPVLSVASPLPTSNGAAPGGIMAFRDASYEAEMHRLENEFLSMISHEIRTPLTNLKAAAQTFARLNRQNDQELGLNLARIISEQCDRLCLLVEKVEDTARLQDLHVAAPAAMVFLPPLIRHLVQIYQHQDRPRAFHLDLDQESALWGWVNDAEFRRVLNSLLDNAVKYSQPWGPITIQARPGGAAELLVAVLDPGPVIPLKQRERIFDRFYRVDNSDARTVYGLGLGLYVARELVLGWGGQIWLDEHDHGGNRFSFTVPHAERTPAP